MGRPKKNLTPEQKKERAKIYKRRNVTVSSNLNGYIYYLAEYVALFKNS